MVVASTAAQSNGDVMRRLDELERALREVAAGRRMESATIGSGGIRVRGGEIVIQTPDGLTDLAVLSSDGIFFNGQPLLLPGSVSWFAGQAVNVPAGWLVADGSAVSRTTYAQLFATIGTTWGVGDGSTTFNLPDLRDRAPVGAGSTYTVGDVVGAATHGHAATGDHGHAATGDHGHAATGDHSHTNPDTSNTGGHSHTIGPGDDVGAFSVGGGVFATVSGDQHNHDGTGAAGSHQHTQGSTGSTGSHAHANTGSHAHANTGSHAHANASSVPPSAALIPIIRT